MTVFEAAVALRSCASSSTGRCSPTSSPGQTPTSSPRWPRTCVVIAAAYPLLIQAFDMQNLQNMLLLSLMIWLTLSSLIRFMSNILHRFWSAHTFKSRLPPATNPSMITPWNWTCRGGGYSDEEEEIERLLGEVDSPAPSRHARTGDAPGVDDTPTRTDHPRQFGTQECGRRSVLRKLGPG